MRDIKFRVWDVDYKRMIYPVGIDWENEHSKDGITVYYWVKGKDGKKHGTPAHKDMVNIMQFTGLKDKEGKEIYEGDILRILYTDWASKDENDPRTLEQYLIDKSTTGYVAWDNHSTGWVVRVKSKYSFDDDGTVMSSIIHGTHGFRQVIGNVHQNPELLN